MRSGKRAVGLHHSLVWDQLCPGTAGGCRVWWMWPSPSRRPDFPLLAPTRTSRCFGIAANKMKDVPPPSRFSFSLLSSGRRYRSWKARTTSVGNSTLPSVIRLLNGRFASNPLQILDFVCGTSALQCGDLYSALCILSCLCCTGLSVHVSQTLRTLLSEDLASGIIIYLIFFPHPELQVFIF